MNHKCHWATSSCVSWCCDPICFIWHAFGRVLPRGAPALLQASL